MNMQITDSLRKTLLIHANAAAPQEACGLIMDNDGDLEYLPLINTAADKENYFRIDPQDYADAEDKGTIAAIFHSHAGEDAIAYPSEIDRAMMQESGLPWVIAAVPADDVQMFEFSAQPFEGRDFVLGSSDCYGLVMAFHRANGISLTDYRQPSEWWNEGADLFTDEHFSETGFQPVKLADIQPGDMVVMKVASRVPNHCGIYCGNGNILHHMADQLSAVDPLFGSYLEPRITHVMRHKDLTGDIKWKP